MLPKDTIELPMVSAAVYFLFSKGEIVYIGASKQIYQRIYQHKRAEKIQFDEVHFLPVLNSELRIVEGIMIERYKPKHNLINYGRFIETGDGVMKGYKHKKRET